jgi:hypothetical protein
MSPHLERFTVLATATMLLSLPAAASDWENVLGVYGIGASISGTGTIRNLELDIDVDFDEILDKLEMGGMARYRGQSDKLAVVGDAVFMGLGEGGADLDLLVLEGSVGYRITKIVEGFIGLRYTDYQFDLRYSGPLQDQRVTAGRTFYDPIVGVRAQGPIGKRWTIQGRGDVGGFGVGMDLTWRVDANIGFEASRLVDIWFGYVALGQDFDAGPNDRLAMDVVYQGPQLGVFFKF